MDRRPLVGITAVLMLSIGAGFYWSPPSSLDGSAIPAVFMRVGMLLGVLWLALPDLGKIPGWLWMNILLTVLVVAWRPRAALIVVPALFVGWMLRPRK